MRKTLIPGLLMLLLSSTVQAKDLPSWFTQVLKVENPSELPIYVYAEENCPFTSDELTEIVSGVLIRSRVKPLPNSNGTEWFERDLFLQIAATCIKAKPPGSNQTFNFAISFGNHSAEPPVGYPKTYGSLRSGLKDFMVSSAQRSVEDAVTDFIKANFDL